MIGDFVTSPSWHWYPDKVLPRLGQGVIHSDKEDVRRLSHCTAWNVQLWTVHSRLLYISTRLQFPEMQHKILKMKRMRPSIEIKNIFQIKMQLTPRRIVIVMINEWKTYGLLGLCLHKDERGAKARNSKHKEKIRKGRTAKPSYL